MKITIEELETLENIRERYKVPAYIGSKVIAYGKPGKIVGVRFSSGHLKILLDGEKKPEPYHPVDGIEYIPDK